MREFIILSENVLQYFWYMKKLKHRGKSIGLEASSTPTSVITQSLKHCCSFLI